MFVHSADKLAEMRTKFHVIQAKLIMFVWCFTVQCHVMYSSILQINIITTSAVRRSTGQAPEGVLGGVDVGVGEQETEEGVEEVAGQAAHPPRHARHQSADDDDDHDEDDHCVQVLITIIMMIITVS